MNVPVLAPRGRWAPVAAVLAVALAGLAAFVQVDLRRDALPEDAVLRLDGRVVTEAELAERVDLLSALYGVQEPEDGDELDRFRRDAAKSLALSLVLEAEAEARGIVISSKEAEAELAKVVDERLGGDRDAFIDYLGAEGLSQDDVLDEIRRTMATAEIYDQVVADVPAATTEEARAEYDARQADMRTAERRQLLNIVVADRDDAELVVQRLAGGADFSAVARRFSLDESTAASGGELGLHSASEMEPAYAEVAFAAGPGEVFGPVQTQYGWNVGQVGRIVPGDPLTFEEVESTLLSALTSQRELEVWEEFLADALAEGEIEYDDRYRPTDPDSLPTEAPDVSPSTDPSTDPTR